MSDSLAPLEEIQAGLKDVMRVYPQGVTVVTTQTGDGPTGVTVSAFTSISLDPPLVLVSIARESTAQTTLLKSKEFAVNFLADDQKSVSDRFAGRHAVDDRFGGIVFTPGATGSLVIQGVRAVIECRTWRVYEGGDHSLLIGEVVNARRLNEKPPLVYYLQQYTTTERPEHSVPQSEITW